MLVDPSVARNSAICKQRVHLSIGAQCYHNPRLCRYDFIKNKKF
jgi:hypothetical protein